MNGPNFVFREADEIDAEVLELTKEVSRFAFPGEGKPTQKTILTGFKDIVSDTIFNAVGSITARKIAAKVRKLKRELESNFFQFGYSTDLLLKARSI